MYVTQSTHLHLPFKVEMVLKARSTLIVLIPVKLAILGAMVIYLKKSKFQLSGASLSRCVARNKNFSYQNQGFSLIA